MQTEGCIITRIQKEAEGEDDGAEHGGGGGESRKWVESERSAATVFDSTLRLTLEHSLLLLLLSHPRAATLVSLLSSP